MPLKNSDGLTPRQQRFVDEYLIDLNATQAAIRSGYSVKTAKAIGTENLSKPTISAVIEKGKVARAAAAGLSVQWVLDGLRENFERAMQAEEVKDREGEGTGAYVYQGAVANRSLELIGKHLSMFTDNTNLRTPDGPLAIAVTHEIIDPAAPA